MTASLKAGFFYFVVLFGIGFLLGTIRVLILVPRFGETVAVAIEGPIILGASWLVCRTLIARFSITRRLSSRIVMGASAFVLLLVAEVILAVVGFGRTIVEHLAHYGSPAGLLGLAGQCLFALFPTIQLAFNPKPAADN